MNKMITYPNGLRLIVENMTSVRTIASSIWVGVGSAVETADSNGMSHFTEHMLFKGTKTMSPFQVADSFEKIGASVNAFTGKENTCYYAKSIDENAEECFDLLTDIFFDSIFDENELNKERNVIIEEINMVEDSPEELCFDLMAKALYADHPIAQTILGSIANVTRFDRNDVLKFMDNFYCAKNIVVSIAGNITLEQADKMLRRRFLGRLHKSDIEVARDTVYEVKSDTKYRFKDFEQSNIAICYPSIPYKSKDFSTQSVLNVILGGGMSSRLFQQIREQMGLAYSIYSGPTSYTNNGSFNILCNITPANTEKTLVAIKQEIDKLVEHGVSEQEFIRAKAQMKSAFVFSSESVQSVMSTSGKLLIMNDEIFDTDKKIQEISNVTIDGVNKFARDIFTKKNVCCAYVGKETKVDLAKIIQ